VVQISVVQIRWTFEAMRCLEGIHAHISSDNPAAASNVVRGIYAKADSSRSISARKIFVRSLTAAGRSARKHRSRFSTEITHCRTGTGGMT